MKARLGITYDYLFHSIPGHYLVLLDNEEKTIIEVSDSMSKILGLERSDVLEHGLLDILPTPPSRQAQEGANALQASFRQCTITGQPHDAGTIRYDVKNQKGKFERRVWEAKNFPIMRKGSVAGILLSLEDVTKEFDESDYTRHRLRHLEHLVEINKSKDEFISIASHQLRTPATGVKQYLGMLRDGLFGELTEQQRVILDRAYESNERQIRIVSDLLKVAQVDAGKVMLHQEAIDINQLVKHIMTDIMDVFEKRQQKVTHHVPRAISPVFVDREIVRMVIENVLDNASKYTNPGGTIDVRVTDNDSTVSVVVSDDGVGVPEEMHQELFKKFSRIDNELSMTVGGTGLGLYWAKRSIDLHGGDIVYRNNHPSGSIFEIILPKK